MSREGHKPHERRQGQISKLVTGGGLNRSSDEDAVMASERRVERVWSSPSSTTPDNGLSGRKTDWYETKGISITLKDFYDAYLVVKKNRGAGGVDGQSLKDFARHLERNLYQLWNRVSSGSYFPSPVREKGIPKEGGKIRYLGIPTVGDRIVQQVVKRIIEPRLEAIFCEGSYGYRPNRGAHDALKAVRLNCIDYLWALDMDISAFFDNVSHELLGLALDRHVSEPWIRLLINRWLKAPIQKEDGELVYREGKGTPQGGVISPLLANLFLHYVLDKWLAQEFPDAQLVRYADDVIIQCNHRPQIELIRRRVEERLEACGLSLNQDKTSIVFCRKIGRKSTHRKVTMDFLGYRFQPRTSKHQKTGKPYLAYDVGISPKSEQKICAYLRGLKLHLWHTAELEDIAVALNSRIRGWINYYGKFNRRQLRRVFSTLNDRLIKWVCRRYKRFGKSARKAGRYLRNLAKEKPRLFAHWEAGFQNA